MPKKLVVLVGNIGSGKSTRSRKYVEDGYWVVSRDALRSMLGAGKYVFSPAGEAAIQAAVLPLVQMLLLEGVDVVVDETNMNPATRKEIIREGQYRGCRIIAHVMPRLSKKESLLRRSKDSLRGNSLKVWAGVWDRFDARYRAPRFDEGFHEIREERRDGTIDYRFMR